MERLAPARCVPLSLLPYPDLINAQASRSMWAATVAAPFGEISTV